MAAEKNPTAVKVVKKPRGEVHILKERCKGCGFCIQFCPTKVLVFSTEFNAKGFHYPVAEAPEKCNGCDLCGMYCPDFAVYGVKFESPKKKEGKKE